MSLFGTGELRELPAGFLCVSIKPPFGKEQRPSGSFCRCCEHPACGYHPNIDLETSHKEFGHCEFSSCSMSFSAKPAFADLS